MTDELVFESNLNAALQLVELKWLSDPIYHRFGLLIRNQSSETFYFKLFNGLPNWDFGTELPGTDEQELGSLAGGTSSWFLIDMVRALPVGEVIDSGNHILKAYLDADYLNEVASDILSMVASIEDLEAWDDVDISDFDDGTAQGWTLGGSPVAAFTVSDVKSVEADGYSLRHAYTSPSPGGHWISAHITKSVYVPNRLKARMSFFYNWAYGNYHLTTTAELHVQVDGVDVYFENRKISPTSVVNWQKYMVDLTSYKGETVDLKIYLKYWSKTGGSFNDFIDRIVIAGKD